MKSKLKGTFKNNDWVIDILDMETKKPIKVGGKYTRKRNYRNKIKYRVNNKGNYQSL